MAPQTVLLSDAEQALVAAFRQLRQARQAYNAAKTASATQGAAEEARREELTEARRSFIALFERDA